MRNLFEAIDEIVRLEREREKKTIERSFPISDDAQGRKHHEQLGQDILTNAIQVRVIRWMLGEDVKL